MREPEPDSAHSFHSPFVPATVGGVRAPIIGRDEPVQQILARFYALESHDNCRLITVVGASGIGKSRLAYELARTLTHGMAQVISVNADAGTRRPYDLIRRLVLAQFDIDEMREVDGGFMRLLEGSQALLGPDGTRAAGLIGRVLGIGPTQPLHEGEHDARAIRDEALRLMLYGIRAVAAGSPLILLLDDLHDADDASLDALEVMVRAGRQLPLLIVGFTQPQLYTRRPEWPELESQRINLEPLSDHLSRLLVGELLRKAGRLPPELRNAIVGNAEGNPRYVEELIGALISDGVIVPKGEIWQISLPRLARVRLPGTMAELLGRRVQALAPASRAVLIDAAVVGRAFWPGALQAQNPDRFASKLEHELAALEHAGLVAHADSQIAGEREYRFAHSLGHEVAARLIPADEWDARHRAVAEWLTLFGEDHAGAVAFHYTQAGDRAEAACWWLRAGHVARGRYAVSAATEAYRQALRLLPEEPSGWADRIVAYEALAELLREQARLAEAVDAYKRIIDLAAASGDRAAAARAWYGMSRAQDDQIETRASRASARNARELALSLGDPELLARIQVQLAMTESRLGDPATAKALCEHSLAAIAQLPEGEVHAVVLAQLGLVYEGAQNFSEARKFLGEAIRIYRELSKQSDLAYQLSNLGYVCNIAGEYDAALTALAESLQLADAIDSRIGAIFALSNQGVALNSLGRYVEAESVMQRGIELCEQSRMAIFPDFYRELAVAVLGQGRVPEAVEAAQQGLELARHEEDPREIAIAWRVLGQAIAAMAEHHGARPCFVESARLLAENQRHADHARTLRTWAAYEQRHGDPAMAQSLNAEADRLFAAVGLL